MDVNFSCLVDAADRNDGWIGFRGRDRLILFTDQPEEIIDGKDCV